MLDRVKSIMKETILVVIPCFNVARFCEAVIEKTVNYVGHLILVDDGSTDETGTILEKFAKNHGNIKVIRFAKNHGKGFALLEAMRYALENYSFDVLITLDSDGQHNPKEITPMATGVIGGADLVIGTREFARMPFRSKFSNRIISYLLRCKYQNSPYDTQSGFRAFGKNLLRLITQTVEGGRYEMEFQCILCALQNNFSISGHPIETVYIEKNKYSQFSAHRDSLRILKVFWQHLRKGCYRKSKKAVLADEQN